MDRLRDRKDMHAGAKKGGSGGRIGTEKNGRMGTEKSGRAGTSPAPTMRDKPVQGIPAGPILAAKRRRHLHPFFYRVGPGTLSVCSVLLIGLMAILYLSQLGQAVNANQQIQNMHQQQATLQRENQDLVNSIAQEESPTYILAHARAMGLVPADPKAVQILVVKHLRTIPHDDQNLQP